MLIAVVVVLAIFLLHLDAIAVLLDVAVVLATFLTHLDAVPVLPVTAFVLGPGVSLVAVLIALSVPEVTSSAAAVVFPAPDVPEAPETVEEALPSVNSAGPGMV